MNGEQLVSAWQAALAAEHRAYFAYGLLGPRLPASQQPLARTCQAAHAALRDATAAAIAAAGRSPVGPLADYPDLYPVPDGPAACRLAGEVEGDCAAAWRYLYAVAASGTVTPRPARLPTPGQFRSSAQTGLTDSAVRAAGWRQIDDPTHATIPFPGI